MSKITAALEDAVKIVILNTPPEGEPQSNRQRVHADRAFSEILKLIAPRIRHFIRQYGLAMHWDDAEQCCAIGVHRAIQAYDPEKAQFTTFVNWQIRGELQGLRFRLMMDQRPSARKVSASTVSLHAVSHGAEGEEASLEALIVDEFALDRTEAGAADYMAAATRTRLIDEYVTHLRVVGTEQLQRRARTRPASDGSSMAGTPRLKSSLYPIDKAEADALEAKIVQHRDAIERRLNGVEADTGGDEVIRERSRQIAKRAAGAIAEMARRAPHFVTAPVLPSAAARSRQGRRADTSGHRTR